MRKREVWLGQDVHAVCLKGVSGPVIGVQYSTFALLETLTVRENTKNCRQPCVSQQRSVIDPMATYSTCTCSCSPAPRVTGYPDTQSGIENDASTSPRHRDR